MSNTPKINKIFHQNVSSSITHIFISGEIQHPEEYIEEFQALKEASQNDTIYIFLNTAGGHIDTALQFVNNIKSCAGKVVGVIEGICHSAGTYIFLACDDWVLNEDVLMMIHNYSGGHYGKGNDLLQAAQETHKWIISLMKNIYTPFLTPEELEVVETKDLYLTPENIMERLDRVIEYRDRLVEEDRIVQLEQVKEQLKGMIPDERQNSTSVPEGPSEL